VLLLNARRRKRRADPQRLDPSGTIAVREEFRKDVDRRFNALKRAVREFVVDGDCFGLAKAKPFDPFRGTPPLVSNAKEFAFQTDQEKVESFQKWFSGQVEAGFLIPKDPADPTQPWTAKYVTSAYKDGKVKAYTDVNKPGMAESVDFFNGTKSEFLRASFNQPETVAKIKLINTRAFTQLKGVTAEMDKNISRVLSEGLAAGLSPRDIGARLDKEVVELGRVRARMIARTEIIYAHSEAMLDTFEEMGVEEVGLLAEWKAAYNACPRCNAKAGKRYKIKEARGMIPLHPNCRCSWAPFIDFFEKPAPTAQPRQRAETRKASQEGVKKAKKQAQLKEAQAKGIAKIKAQKEAAAKAKAAKIAEGPEGPKASPEQIAEAKKLQAEAEKAAAKKAQLKAAQLKGAQAMKAKALAKKQAAAQLAQIEKEAAEQAAKIVAEQAEAAAKKAAAAKIAEIKKAVESKEAAGALPSLADLKKIKSLPGSTRPDLMENATTGKKWVMKSTQSGIAPDHLRSEALADDLYRVLGLDAPKSGIVETAEGPAKLSEFLEGGQTLSEWKAGKSAKAVQGMYDQIADGFVADALFANHDVVGLSYDNVFIVGGKSYRIDNGGAFFFRAQGAPKRDFGKVVQELTSMRDPAVNPQTAAVFGRLTEADIDDQITRILAKREALLAAVPDARLRGVLADRLDYLATRVKPTPVAAVPGVPAQAAARAKARLAEPGVLPDTAERVKAARINGVTIKGDRGDIEDTNILAWEEKDLDGKDVTRLQLKVTKAGSDKIVANLDPATIAATRSSGSLPRGAHPDDVYWGDVQKAAKTVAVHAADGKYNMAVLETLEAHEKALPGLYLKAKGDKKEMYAHYLAEIGKIQDAKKKGEAPQTVAQFLGAKPDPKTAQKGGKFAARPEPLRFNLADVKNGRAVRRAGTNDVGGGWSGSVNQYRIEVGDDVEVLFHENTGLVEQTSGLAFQGNVELKIPGGASPETLRKGLDKLRSLGIDVTPPTPDYEELLYLHRSVYLRRDHTKPEYATIFTDSSLSDAEKVGRIKEWAAKEYGVDFAKVSYNPEGKTKTSFGDGYRHWERWDLPPETLRKSLKGYTLQHSTSRDVADVVDSLLQTGGEFTPTVQRVRKGVDVSATGGMSAQSDIASGGASYFFTRITGPNSNRGQFRFKIDALARQDAISYEGDFFGRISAIDQRKSTVEQYKETAKRGSNETILKHGVSLLDDLDHIKAYTAAERERIIEAFRRNKVTVLPDGRKIEDVVKL
jgi:SPP1 gp7 family putative phage head morphogenesis protein